MTDSFKPPAPLRTAVLFLIFNRPELTAQVFEAIRKAKPPRLYVAADGPRDGRTGEAEKVASVRQIATSVDWPCDVKTLFREKNLGCKHAVSGGITWFFQNENQGIILEDDCLPSQSFFWFCEELLDHFKNDLRIWHISGNNFYRHYSCRYSYSFGGIYGSIWGWASWADRWAKYDIEMNKYKETLESGLLSSTYDGGQAVQARLRDFEAIKCGLDTWDYQWVFCRWINSALTVIPSVNMIKNLGFGPDATHTIDIPDPSKVKACEEIRFPLSHPAIIIRDSKMEQSLVKKVKTQKYRKALIQRIKKLWAKS